MTSDIQASDQSAAPNCLVRISDNYSWIENSQGLVQRQNQLHQNQLEYLLKMYISWGWEVEEGRGIYIYMYLYIYIFIADSRCYTEESITL